MTILFHIILSLQSTSNYHARRYGVRAAMPGFIAKKLCPELIITPLNFDKYRAVSKQVREILGVYDPYFCPMSLDEAYFDLTDHLEKRKVMSEDERTFEYADWNKDAKGVDNEGAVQSEGAHVKKDGRNWKSDSTAQDTRMGMGVVSDNSHAVLSLDCNNSRMSSTTETSPLSTHKLSLDNPEKTRVLLSQTNLVMSNVKGISDDTHVMSFFKDNNQAGISRPFSPEVVLDKPHPSPAMVSSCTIHEDTPKDIMAISSKRGRCRTFGLTVEEVVEEIRFRIEQKTQLTASAGKQHSSI